MKQIVELIPIKENDKEWFIKDLQKAFRIAVIEEYGEQEGEIIPREDIEKSMDTKGAETFHIVLNGKTVGGVVVVIDEKTQHNSLDLLFVRQVSHSRGIGHAVWKKIEQRYPKTKVWETITPYFEKRNIHFYVNKCGFHIVEFFNSHHRDACMTDDSIPGSNELFRFEKVMDK